MVFAPAYGETDLSTVRSGPSAKGFNGKQIDGVMPRLGQFIQLKPFLRRADSTGPGGRFTRMLVTNASRGKEIALRQVGISTQLAVVAAMLLSCTSASAEPSGLLWKYSKIPLGAYLAGIHNHQQKIEALGRRMAGDGRAIIDTDFNATNVKFQIQCDADGLTFNISGNDYFIDESKYKANIVDIFENNLIKPVSVIVNGAPAININSVMGTISGVAAHGNKIYFLAQVFSFLKKSGEFQKSEAEIHVFTPDGIKIHKYDPSFNDNENRSEILKFKNECRNVAKSWSAN